MFGKCEYYERPTLNDIELKCAFCDDHPHNLIEPYCRKINYPCNDPWVPILVNGRSGFQCALNHLVDNCYSYESIKNYIAGPCYKCHNPFILFRRFTGKT